MGPSHAIAVVLLWPLAALRDLESERLELEEGDECDQEAKELMQLFHSWDIRGPFSQDHCDWPGVLCDLERCRVEELECDACSGQLPVRMPLRYLKKVALLSPKIAGDIQTFQGLPLHELKLAGTEISGDLGIFQASQTLARLQVPNSKTFGDLKDFEGLWMYDLNLRGTKVTGDLKSLVGSLQRLDLAYTLISGQLGSLAHLQALESIDLTGTDVSGKLEDLAGAGETSLEDWKHLKYLNLGKTRVFGDFLALTRFWAIQEVDLSFTSVVGSLSPEWQGSCTDLKSLQLQNSSIKFAPSTHDYHELLVSGNAQPGTLVLPALKDLDLTNCPVNAQVNTLLWPLAMCEHLATIKAVAAGLDGSVPEMKDSSGWTLFAGIMGYIYPLVNSLEVLDLSNNHVSSIDGLPVRSGAGRVILRENQALKAAKGISLALKDQIILDLEGTRLLDQEETEEVSKETLKSTDLYAYRNDVAGFACKAVANSVVKMTPNLFLPEKLCKCLPGWYGNGATCKMCPANSFSDEMGFATCNACPPNSTAPAGSTKLASCKCQFGDLHNGTCTCGKHQTLQDRNCILCSKLHLQCDVAGMSASVAVPEVNHARLAANAEEARKCLPPAERCPGGHNCGLGYSGSLCASCADGFWASEGLCRPCRKKSTTTILILALLAVAVVLAALILGYLCVHGRRQPSQAKSVKGLLLKRLVIQAPILLQTVQLWTVLSRLGNQRGSETLAEVSFLEPLLVTIRDLQHMLNLQCDFDANRVRTVAAIGSPLLMLLLLGCCAALELCRAGLGVNLALKTVTLLFIGGAFSTAELLSCQYEDGDGESLGDFAFRTALPQLHCSQRDGIGFWINTVGYTSAMAYGLLIPLFLAGLMLRQYVVLQEARLFFACAQGEPQNITLRLQALQGELPKEGIQKFLLAAAAAHMAVHCQGKRCVQLYDSYVITSSTEISDAKVADGEASKKDHVLKSRKIAKMLTERIILGASDDRLLMGSQSLLTKYALSRDVWMFVAIKLFAVALVSCVSMKDAWKWPVAFSLGMGTLVSVCQPYADPQVNQLQGFSCYSLALASLAFIYDCPWLARVGLFSPFVLLLLQVKYPDYAAALAERLYEELQSELPKLQQGEAHEVQVQQLR